MRPVGWLAEVLYQYSPSEIRLASQSATDPLVRKSARPRRDAVLGQLPRATVHIDSPRFRHVGTEPIEWQVAQYS